MDTPERRTIRAWRLERGMTQEQLADAVGVSHISVGNWDNGRAEPTSRQLEKLATVFDVRMDQIAFHKEAALAERMAQAR